MLNDGLQGTAGMSLQGVLNRLKKENPSLGTNTLTEAEFMKQYPNYTSPATTGLNSQEQGEQDGGIMNTLGRGARSVADAFGRTYDRFADLGNSVLDKAHESFKPVDEAIEPITGTIRSMSKATADTLRNGWNSFTKGFNTPTGVNTEAEAQALAQSQAGSTGATDSLMKALLGGGYSQKEAEDTVKLANAFNSKVLGGGVGSLSPDELKELKDALEAIGSSQFMRQTVGTNGIGIAVKRMKERRKKTNK